jgi:hypothetical protein
MHFQVTVHYSLIVWYGSSLQVSKKKNKINQGLVPASVREKEVLNKGDSYLT